MSRKYMNDRWCVRCGRKAPSPYLVKKWPEILEYLSPPSPLGMSAIWRASNLTAIDVGCGNGRNSRFLRRHHVGSVWSLDMAGDDHTMRTVLGQDTFPVDDSAADLVLANYVFMFLDERERAQVYRQIRNAMACRAVIVVELYPAKDSHFKTKQSLTRLKNEICRAFPGMVFDGYVEHFTLIGELQYKGE